MAIDLAPELLDILACPNCHGSLAVDHDRDELVCLAADCGLAYPVRQGIPVLLIDEARRPGSDLPGSPGEPARSADSGDAADAAESSGSPAGPATGTSAGPTTGASAGPTTGASATDGDKQT